MYQIHIYDFIICSRNTMITFNVCKSPKVSYIRKLSRFRYDDSAQCQDYFFSPNFEMHYTIDQEVAVHRLDVNQ